MGFGPSLVLGPPGCRGGRHACLVPVPPAETPTCVRRLQDAPLAPPQRLKQIPNKTNPILQKNKSSPGVANIVLRKSAASAEHVMMDSGRQKFVSDNRWPSVLLGWRGREGVRARWPRRGEGGGAAPPGPPSPSRPSPSDLPYTR